MCPDMCTDMCKGMRIDVFIGMCVDMCMYLCVRMGTDVLASWQVKANVAKSVGQLEDCVAQLQVQPTTYSPII